MKRTLLSRRRVLAALIGLPLARRALEASSLEEASTAPLVADVSVKDFGALGNGKTNDRSAIRKALKVSNRVLFPAGIYYLGELSKGEVAFELGDFGKNAALLNAGPVSFLFNTTDRSITQIFSLSAVNDCEIGDFAFEDLGGDNMHSWRGAIAFFLNSEAKSSTNIRFGSIYGKRLVSPVSIRGKSSLYRVRGIRIDKITCVECFYGFNCQDNGDDVDIGLISTEGCRRSYFVYGVRDHKVSIESRQGKASTSDVLIKRYKFDTSGIALRYLCLDSKIEAPNGLVALDQQPEPGTAPGRITDVHLDLDIRMPTSSAYPVLLRSYTSDGKEETDGTRSVWGPISVTGKVITKATDVIHMTTRATTRGSLRVQLCANATINEVARKSFDVTSLQPSC